MNRYVSQEGRAVLLALYDRWLQEVRLPLVERRLTTRAGPIRAWLGGPSDGSPVVVLAGIGPCVKLLVDHPFLLASHRVIALDLPGEPGGSAPERPDPNLPWLLDILDALDVPSAGVFATSSAAVPVLPMLGTHSHRLTRVVLAMPLGVASETSLRVLTRLSLPRWAHRLFPTPGRAARLTANYFMGDPPLDWVDWIGARARFLADDGLPRGPMTPRTSPTPVLLVLAEGEVHYYPFVLRDSAASRFGDAVEVRLLDTGHLCAGRSLQQLSELAEAMLRPR